MLGGRLNTLLIGFPHGSFKPNDSIIYAIINNWVHPSDEAVSGREQYATLVKLARSADLVLINLQKKLEVYEIVLLHLAYSNRTPVLGVGKVSKSDDALVAEFVCNELSDIEMAEAYLENFYV